MKVTKTIEYYASCPKCGAPNTGARERCEFCGALLVKSESEEYDRPVKTQDDINAMEDAEFEIVEAKSCGSNMFLNIFCIMFGGMFILIPTGICSAFAAAGAMEGWLWSFFAIFWIIGAGALVPLFISIIRGVTCSMKGEVISGEVRGYENSMSTVNGSPVKIVRLKIYEDSRYKILCLNTGSPRIKYPLGSTVKIKKYKKICKIM